MESPHLIECTAQHLVDPPLPAGPDAIEGLPDVSAPLIASAQRDTPPYPQNPEFRFDQYGKVAEPDDSATGEVTVDCLWGNPHDVP
jgi:hypothetical protein